LAGGLTETLYVASVMVDATACNLKEVHASCHQETITIHLNGTVFTLPKAAVSTGGNWFVVERSTSKEALGVAMSMCPDKVKSYLQ
jgi:hypothetical protein